MRARNLLLVAAGLLPALAWADGQHGGGSGGVAGNPARVDRVVEVVMDDGMRFAPASIEVKKGETVRFFVRNAGKIEHEMVLGQMAQLREHAEMMRRMPDMQHAEPNMVRLKPGQRGAIVWQFTHAGVLDFACTIPGHLEAGMAGKVTVK